MIKRVGLRAKTYSYLIDDIVKINKQKTQISFIKRKLKVIKTA